MDFYNKLKQNKIRLIQSHYNQNLLNYSSISFTLKKMFVRFYTYFLEIKVNKKDCPL